MQNGRKSIPWYLSGWALIAALIVFWPVGLLLVLGRIKTDRSFHGAAARTLQITGWILSISFGRVFLAGCIEPSTGTYKIFCIGGLNVCPLFNAGGIVLVPKGT